MSDSGFLRGEDGERTGPSVTLDPSLDPAVGVLVDHRRRGALYVLSETGGKPVFAVDLAQKVALMHPDSPDIETLLTELHHVHLPKLADAGLVEFDRSSGLVRYDADEDVERLLAEAKHTERTD